MASVDTPAVAELTYEEYQQRQVREVTEAQLRYRAGQLRQADHFAYVDGQWQRLPYEGYAVVSMVDTNSGNDAVSTRLLAMQEQLAANFDRPDAFFPLPADSFHQTVANTLSADRYHTHVVAAGLTADYPALVRGAFAQLPPAIDAAPIRMRLIGLSLFSSAVGMLGTFDDNADFWRILHFRDRFYAHEPLRALTVRRTRPFIGHITLAYFGSLLSEAEKTGLVGTCAAVNEALAREPLFFTISTTELRSYQHLAHFETRPDYPVYSFIKS